MLFFLSVFWQFRFPWFRGYAKGPQGRPPLSTYMASPTANRDDVGSVFAEHLRKLFRSVIKSNLNESGVRVSLAASEVTPLPPPHPRPPMPISANPETTFISTVPLVM
jgi:hypothetical protein